MPEINGLTLYKKIREIDNKVQVFFLTALSDFSNYKQKPNETAFTLREKNLIQKPIDNEALLKRIKTMKGTST